MVRDFVLGEKCDIPIQALLTAMVLPWYSSQGLTSNSPPSTQMSPNQTRVDVIALLCWHSPELESNTA